MIRLVIMFVLLYSLSAKVVGSEVDASQQIEVVKQYYLNLLHNKLEQSYQLLSAKDKSTYTEAQFVRVINLSSALYDPNRVVTIKDAVIEDSEEGMAVVKIFAELSTKGEQELKNLTASQIVVQENKKWHVYSVQTIASMLIRAKTVCDSSEPIPLVQREKGCFVYYGKLKQ